MPDDENSQGDAPEQDPQPNSVVTPTDGTESPPQTDPPSNPTPGTGNVPVVEGD